MGHEDAALRRLRGGEAATEAGSSGSEVLVWALEGDRWLQDSRVRHMLLCCPCMQAGTC